MEAVQSWVDYKPRAVTLGFLQSWPQNRTHDVTSVKSEKTFWVGARLKTQRQLWNVLRLIEEGRANILRVFFFFLKEKIQNDSMFPLEQLKVLTAAPANISHAQKQQAADGKDDVEELKFMVPLSHTYGNSSLG